MKHLFAILTLTLGITAQAHADNRQLTSYDGPYVAPGDAMYNIQSGLNTAPQPSVNAIQPVTPKSMENDASYDNIPPPNNDVKSNDVSAPPAQGS